MLVIREKKGNIRKEKDIAVFLMTSPSALPSLMSHLLSNENNPFVEENQGGNQ